jgi:hypothetical protein
MPAYVIFLGGGGSSGGGGTTTQLDTTGFYVTPTTALSHTITTANVTPSPTAGDKILFCIVAAGPSDVPAVTFTHPGSIVKEYPGSNYFPRMRIVAVDYNGTNNSFPFTGTAPIRVAAVVVPGASTFSASNPVAMFSPVDPGAVTGAVAGCLGLTFVCTNFNTASITGPSANNFTVLNLAGDVRNIYVQKRLLTSSGTYDPGVLASGAGEESTAISIVCFPAGTSGGGSIPPPTIPTFNAASAITINPTDNAASIVAAQPAGTHFKLVAGTYTNFNDVRPKTGNHFQGAGASTILEGSGKAYGFRAGANGTSDNVVIGNMWLRNYGNGTSRAEYGAIQAQPTDTVGNQFTYGHANNWFIYDVTLEKNSSNGIRMSDNCTLYRCTSFGHTVTGAGCDRGVGGLIHSCTFEANALNPSTGAGQNGAQVKLTFHNADEGRSDVLPAATLRAKAHFTVASSTFNATRAGIPGSCTIGMWFDLDCKDTEVVDCNFSNHSTTSIFWEGSNNGVARRNVVNNSDGFGPAFNGDFSNAGISFGESTNMVAEDNTLIGCDYALMNRMSNRTSDWINSNNSSFVNFAWPTSSGGVRYWITFGTAAPIPSPTARSNVWTGNNTFQRNTLIGCSRVVINEGVNTAGQTVQGSTDLSSIRFIGNDYSQSPSIVFHNLSNTGISLAAWKALPYNRDQ